MIAVVMVGSPSAIYSLGLLIALGILAAHLGAYRPKVKRAIAVAVVAVAVSTPTLRAEDDPGLVIGNPCKQYEPWSFPWIAAGCYLDFLP